MITKIPDGQLCQAFDPIMILPEKTNYIISDHMRANTSCVAPAYVYIDGSRGKRFLCDYHYHYEKDITITRTPHLWSSIANVILDNRESIRKTFPKIAGESKYTAFGRCWCGYTSLVKAIRHDDKSFTFFCNFHYRKLFFRYLSNGRQMTEDYSIIDERANLKISIAEEAEQLTLI